MPEPQWRELSPEEILPALQAQARSSPSPASGFLDVHQWAGLRSLPALRFSQPHPEAQFCRVGLEYLPPVTILGIALELLPLHQRSPRALRRLLEQLAGDVSAIGDLTITGPKAIFAIDQVERLRQQLECVPDAWPVDGPAIQSASVAALRLDAVIARVFNVSRAEAQVAITHGFVFLDFRPVDKPARPVAADANLVFRGKGRVKLLGSATNQRSGRVNLSYSSWPV